MAAVPGDAGAFGLLAVATLHAIALAAEQLLTGEAARVLSSGIGNPRANQSLASSKLGEGGHDAGVPQLAGRVSIGRIRPVGELVVDPL